MGRYPMMESLYYSYVESQKGDSAEVKRLFGALEENLRGITRDRENEITDIVCALCTEHERSAYIAGFRDAARMMHELTQFRNEIATSLRSSQ